MKKLFGLIIVVCLLSTFALAADDDNLSDLDQGSIVGDQPVDIFEDGILMGDNFVDPSIGPDGQPLDEPELFGDDGQKKDDDEKDGSDKDQGDGKIDNDQKDDIIFNGVTISEAELELLEDDAKMCAIELGRKDDLIMGLDARVTELIAFIEEQGLEVPDESSEVTDLLNTDEFDELMDGQASDLVEETEAKIEEPEHKNLLQRFFGFFAPKDGELPLDQQIIE